MSSRLETPAAVPPVTVDDAKHQLRLEQSDTSQDSELERLIAAATTSAENLTGRALIEQTWVASFDCFPDAVIWLPRPPLIEITSIKYFDREGAEQTLPANQYRELSKAATYARGGIEPAFCTSWPVTADGKEVVTVTYKAGYGAAASDVPPDIQHAILLTVGSMYEHREDVVTGTIAIRMPQSAEHLLAPYRIPVI